MKIMVTGGAGFIGSHVVDKYIAEGHKVTVVDNLFTGEEQNINPSAKFYLMDIRSNLLEEVFKIEKPEIVNHHAAQISVPASVEDPLFDAGVNILGLLNLLQYSVKYMVKKIIFISSGGAIYGEADVFPTPEDYPLRPSSPYAISKLISEYYLNFYKKQYGIDFTVLRYANIYGPRQVPHGEAGVVSIFIEKLLKGESPTIYFHDGEPDGMTRDYCYVEDVVKANLFALEKGSGEIFNIGTGKGTLTKELYRNILNLIRVSGYAKEAIYDEPHRGPARPGDIKKSCIDIKKAQNLLGWKPEHNLLSGLENTLKWFLAKHSTE
ncbi:MAG: NAD-dependent epimerase/dehydratase family protein [Nitrospirae bacterium]|nr:NAD-dependent epimerase/dehydratase family protein [Nitrospirota bacterium]